MSHKVELIFSLQRLLKHTETLNKTRVRDFLYSEIPENKKHHKTLEERSIYVILVHLVQPQPDDPSYGRFPGLQTVLFSENHVTEGGPPLEKYYKPDSRNKGSKFTDRVLINHELHQKQKFPAIPVINYMYCDTLLTRQIGNSLQLYGPRYVDLFCFYYETGHPRLSDFSVLLIRLREKTGENFYTTPYYIFNFNIFYQLIEFRWINFNGSSTFTLNSTRIFLQYTIEGKQCVNDHVRIK